MEHGTGQQETGPNGRPGAKEGCDPANPAPALRGKTDGPTERGSVVVLVARVDVKGEGGAGVGPTNPHRGGKADSGITQSVGAAVGIQFQEEPAAANPWSGCSAAMEKVVEGMVPWRIPPPLSALSPSPSRRAA
ncbi:hypothetical protein GCM10023160_26840 [Brachybacterium paraconglomeratum]